MAQFDPRRRPLRFAPHLLTAAAAITVLGLCWRVFEAPSAEASVTQQLDPTAVAALEAKAFAAGSTTPGFAMPTSVNVTVKSGETLEQAVRRLGVAPGDAAAAIDALRANGVNAVSAFQAAIAAPRGGRGSARLVGLTMRTGPASSMTVSRTFDGAMKLRELQERVAAEITVAHGQVNGSLFQSAYALGATPDVTRQLVKLYSHKLDFDRDIGNGDNFTLVFDRSVSESGRTVDTGALRYAELESRGHSVRLYRFIRGGKAEYFDEFGKNIKGFLLRTPVDGARMSSTFGMRRHPILGYARMHQGIDFAAGTGTPVLAAGDGVVVEVRRWGGYGNWLRIRHAGGWETGYGHLSRYAKGLRPGMVVHQGQLVAYVGTTGASTGPHLHYETWLKGRRVNPVGARIPQGVILSGAELAAFRAEKGRIDALIAQEKREQAEARRPKKTQALRPVLVATAPTSARGR